MISDCFSSVRAKRPLVCHITNSVTMNDCANICICAGGSPVMSCQKYDVTSLMGKADALVLNIGTLDDHQLETMLAAGRLAKEREIPVVFDPVGIGASEYRANAAETIIKAVRPDIIKGNHGEIAFLYGIKDSMKGVDSSILSDDMSEKVRTLAAKYGCIVASTGETDVVSDGKETYLLSNGCPMEEFVSGTGCMLTSVIGAFIGANGATIEAVTAGITVFNIAAEHADKISVGPGTFKVNLFDCLYGLKEDDISEESRIKAC